MTIGLVSCVKTKLTSPAKAGDLYISSLFKKSREWAENNCDKWYVLSAKHGLLHPEQLVEPYELTLKLLSAADRKLWSGRVYEMMEDAGLLKPASHFIWLAGRDYSQELGRLLKPYRQTDPLMGLRMGNRLKWLRKQLAKD